MLNIRTRAVAETLTFDLTDADDAPLVDDAGHPVRCTVYGPGSRRFQQAQQRRQDRLMEKAVRRKAMPAEEQARVQAEFLADITESIDVAYDDLDGREKLIAIYSDPAVGYIRDQVERKVSDWGNFKQGSPKP